MKKLIFLFIIVLPYISNAQQSLGAERVKRLKESVVRILIENRPSGSAFFVSDNGLLVSCWHVIEPALIRDPATNSIIGIKKISIEFSTQEKIDANIPVRFIANNYNDAIAFDYVLLKITDKPKTNFSFLKLGDFSNINEGDIIYSAGYPLGVQQHLISFGVLSTKWVDSVSVYDSDVLTKTYIRDVAWLDLTMNRGNSGGPIIKIGNTPDADEVIGISTFILNPFAPDAEHLANLLSSGAIQADINMGGVSNNEINKLFAKAIANNSIGVSGCVSINHLLNNLR